MDQHGCSSGAAAAESGVGLPKEAGQAFPLGPFCPASLAPLTKTLGKFSWTSPNLVCANPNKSPFSLWEVSPNSHQRQKRPACHAGNIRIETSSRPPRAGPGSRAPHQQQSAIRLSVLLACTSHNDDVYNNNDLAPVCASREKESATFIWAEDRGESGTGWSATTIRDDRGFLFFYGP
jgi:hypothetical protein